MLLFLLGKVAANLDTSCTTDTLPRPDVNEHYFNQLEGALHAVVIGTLQFSGQQLLLSCLICNVSHGWDCNRKRTSAAAASKTFCQGLSKAGTS
jgi:hypothetical protein